MMNSVIQNIYFPFFKLALFSRCFSAKESDLLQTMMIEK
jgi:hypothetical protein